MSTLKVGTIQSTTANTAMTISSDGTFKPEKIPAFRVHTTSNVSASSGSWTNIPLNTTSGTGVQGFDTHSMMSNNNINITAATAGIYFFTGHVRMVNTVPYRLIVRILRVADQVIVLQSEVGNEHPNLTGRYQSVQTNGLVQCSAGDVFQMDFYQNNESGNSQSATGVNSHETFMSGFRISA